jgi:hypothetical protein
MGHLFINNSSYKQELANPRVPPERHPLQIATQKIEDNIFLPKRNTLVTMHTRRSWLDRLSTPYSIPFSTHLPPGSEPTTSPPAKRCAPLTVKTHRIKRYLYIACTLPTSKRVFERMDTRIEKNNQCHRVRLGKNCFRRDRSLHCSNRNVFEKISKTTICRSLLGKLPTPDYALNLHFF